MLTIRIAGPGCANCEKLFHMCMNVAAENDLDADIQKITDIEKFAELGIWVTPALVVNGKILIQGKLPTQSTLEHWLKQESVH